MKAFVFIAYLISSSGYTQSISISPSNNVENTVSLSYYDTEYIYITNTGTQTIELSFELVENTLPTEWGTSGCTNMICYPGIPDDGTFGEIPPDYQAYIAINISTNDAVGSGLVRYTIYDKSNPEIRDTISFFYKVEEELPSNPQPWAKINFAQNVITLFLENEGIETTVKIYDLSGRLILQNPLEAITSFSLVHLAQGVYIVSVESENGKQLVQKIGVNL